jgi:acyl-CoA synthetase (AMP-forming)/AMP-acid ligase II
LRTGDLGFLQAGELYVTGRLKDLLIIRGTNLYPDDVEQAARAAHPRLQHQASAAFTVDLAHEVGLVVVQEVDLRALQAIDVAALVVDVTASIVSSFGVTLSDLVLVRTGALERTTSGKISRTACRAAYLRGELQRTHTQPAATGLHHSE